MSVSRITRTELRKIAAAAPAAERAAAIVSSKAFADSVAKLTAKRDADGGIDAAHRDDVLGLVAERILTFKKVIDPAAVDGLITQTVLFVLADLVREGRNWRKEKAAQAAAQAAAPETATEAEKAIAVADAIADVRAEIRGGRAVLVGDWTTEAAPSVPAIDAGAIADAEAFANLADVVNTVWFDGTGTGDEDMLDTAERTASRRAVNKKAVLGAFLRCQAAGADVTIADVQEVLACSNPFTAWSNDELGRGAATIIETPWMRLNWCDRADRIAEVANADKPFAAWFDALVG